jgi:hypothetical protein
VWATNPAGRKQMALSKQKRLTSDAGIYNIGHRLSFVHLIAGGCGACRDLPSLFCTVRLDNLKFAVKMAFVVIANPGKTKNL